METKRGIVIRLATKKGFGFIRQDDGTDIFFHAMGCVSPDFKHLREGVEVEYMAVFEPEKKRPRAIGVVVV